MSRSVITRRQFVQAAVTLVSCGTESLTTNANTGAAAQHESMQREEGVRYHRAIHASDIMVGSPPPMDKRVTIDSYLSSRDRFRWAMLNADTVFHTREIETGGTPVRGLPRCTVDPERVDGEVEWGKAGLVTVAEWLAAAARMPFWLCMTDTS